MSSHPPTTPNTPADHSPGRSSGRSRVAWHWITVVYLMSLAVMIPWPVAGIALASSFFENDWEASFMFGGVTAIPIAMIALAFGGVSEEGMIGIMFVVWALFLLLPPLLVFMIRPVRWLIITMLACQAAFSMIQAAMGALMVLGKSV